MCSPGPRGPLLLQLLLLHGCGSTRLIDELVLGRDIPASTVEGIPGEALGALVATDGEHVLAYSDGSACLSLFSPRGVPIWRQETQGPLTSIWLLDGVAYGWEAAAGLRRFDADGGWAVELDTSGPPCWTGDAWRTVDGADQLVCDTDGHALWSACLADGCDVFLDGVLLAEGGPTVTLGFLEGVACWSFTDLAADPQPGQVACADGVTFSGLEGDHMGMGLGGERAAGVFNKWIVPPRLRLQGRDGVVWAIEHVRERSGAAVAAHNGLVVVGVPGHLETHGDNGRIYIMEP